MVGVTLLKLAIMAMAPLLGRRDRAQCRADQHAKRHGESLINQILQPLSVEKERREKTLLCLVFLPTERSFSRAFEWKILRIMPWPNNITRQRLHCQQYRHWHQCLCQQPTILRLLARSLHVNQTQSGNSICYSDLLSLLSSPLSTLH